MRRQVMFGEFFEHLRVVLHRSLLPSLDHSLEVLTLALDLLVLLLQQLKEYIGEVFDFTLLTRVSLPFSESRASSLS